VWLIAAVVVTIIATVLGPVPSSATPMTPAPGAAQATRLDAASTRAKPKRVPGRTLVLVVRQAPKRTKVPMVIKGPKRFHRYVKVTDRERLKHLRSGRYRVSTRFASAANASYSVQPRTVRISRKRGARAFVTYRPITRPTPRPSATPTGPDPATPPTTPTQPEPGVTEPTDDPTATPPDVPAGFQDQAVWPGLSLPTAIAFAPDGSVFVAEKSGMLYRFDSVDDTTGTPVADLRTEVYNYIDRGLLGLAVDPSFGPARPYVYVQYSYDHILGSTAPAPRWGSPGEEWDDCPTPPESTTDGCVTSGRISRLTLSAPAGPMSAEKVLVEDWCEQFPSHSIGTIAFGHDGRLYAGGGDGASYNNVDYGQYGGRMTNTPTPVNPCGDAPTAIGTAPTAKTAQGGALRSQAPGVGARESTTDKVSLSGSIIRIDPDTGAGVSGNPWFDKPGADANERRIIAYGLRNPFRFSFRGGTNELWVGDVGWNSNEEINVIPDPSSMSKPLNYGWPCYEGNGRQEGYDAADIDVCEHLYAQGQAAVVEPHYTYSHRASPVPGDDCPVGGSSIAGVAYYQRPEGPGITAYPARYDNAVFFTDYNRRCIWSMMPGNDGRPDPNSVELFHRAVGGIVDLVLGPNGDLYYPDIDNGTIRRIRYYPDNAPPAPAFTATPAWGPAPLTVSFNASGTTDPDGDDITYLWDLDDDGQYDDATGVTASRTYDAGTRLIGLKVVDPQGAYQTLSHEIQPGNTPPVATIDSPSTSTTWKVGDAISFSGSASDPEEGAIPAARLHWDVSLLTCDASGTTCVTRRSDPFDGSSETYVAPDWSGEGRSILEFRLTATDTHGLTGVSTLRLDPRMVDLTFRTDPEGLSIGLGSTTVSSTTTRTVIQGSTQDVAAPSPQTLAGDQYQFESWSDGGASGHSFSAPATPTTYTAHFGRHD
jgi:glucose/arabinose dehydrogenase